MANKGLDCCWLVHSGSEERGLIKPRFLSYRVTVPLFLRNPRFRVWGPSQVGNLMAIYPGQASETRVEPNQMPFLARGNPSLLV